MKHENKHAAGLVCYHLHRHNPFSSAPSGLYRNLVSVARNVWSISRKVPQPLVLHGIRNEQRTS